MIGDVLLDCDWAGRTLAGFENHAGRTHLDAGAEPLGRVLAGFGNDGESGYEGCRAGRVYGTYLHGPLLPAERLVRRPPARATRSRTRPATEHELRRSPDELEAEAHAVSAERARARGGRSSATRASRGTRPGRRAASAGGSA